MAQRGCLMITTTKIIIMTIMMVSLKHSTPVYNCKLSYSLIPALYLSRKDTLLCYTVLPKCFLCGLLSGWNKIYSSSKISSKSYLKKCLYQHSQNLKTWDSKCLALIAQMVRTFGLNPKVGGSSPLRSDIFRLKTFDTFTRTPVRVSKMKAVAPAQLTFQKLTLLQKYLYRQRQY